MKKLAVFASGTGSNAQQIIRQFQQHPTIRVSLIVCNRPGAGVIEVAASAGIPVLMVERERFLRGDAYLPELKTAGIDAIILAGFLWKMPDTLVSAFRDNILNIHPALLPNYGGKGMYGMHVHEAVIAARERESGITIHVVDEQYDHGQTLFQARLTIRTDETPATLAQRIQELEHRHYPPIIETFLTGNSDMPAAEKATSEP